MTLDLRWIEDAEKRPPARQLRMLGGYCCAEVAAIKGWSWGRAARAMRRRALVEPGSLKGQRVDDAAVARL